MCTHSSSSGKKFSSKFFFRSEPIRPSNLQQYFYFFQFHQTTIIISEDDSRCIYNKQWTFCLILTSTPSPRIGSWLWNRELVNSQQNIYPLLSFKKILSTPIQSYDSREDSWRNDLQIKLSSNQRFMHYQKKNPSKSEI